MSNPYIGEIRMFAGNFAPQGWLLCQGQLVSISDYDTLFNLIGTTYGGDGVNTFALPNLASRLPVHAGPGYTLGQSGGVETVTLLASQMPVHTHAARASSAPGTTPAPDGAVWAAGSFAAYSDQAAGDVLATGSVAITGGSQPHDNASPYLAINFIISLFGIYPSPS